MLKVGLGTKTIANHSNQLNSIVAGLQTLAQYGSNAHMWIPGVGDFNGLQAQNYLDSAGTTAASVDNPVGLVKDLITAGAINASQATTANKPTLRRGVTNTILNSNALATGWSINNSGVPTNSAVVGLDGVTQNASSLACPAGNSGVYSYANPNAVAGVPVTQCAVVKLLTGTSAAFRMGADYSTTYITINPQTNVIASAATSITQSSLAPMGNGYYLYAWSFVTPAANPPLVLNNQGGAAVTMAVANTGQFTGTLTAAQILAAGGIPLTTSAAASSSAGNWGWEMNGTTNFFNVSGYSPTSAATLVFGARINSYSGTPVVLAQPAGGVQLYVNSGGGLQAGIAGGSNFGSANGTVTTGVPLVASARIIQSGASVIRANGSVVATSGAITAAMNQSSLAIGSNGASNNMPGLLGPLVALTVAPSDSDLLAIERMIGALTGPTGVVF